MAKLNQTFNCTCCGSVVTAPYFHGNGVYGWTCIKKVNPSAKKNKAVYVKADAVEIKRVSDSMMGKAIATIEGVKVNAGRVIFTGETSYKTSNIKETDQGVFVMVKDNKGLILYRDKRTDKPLFV